MLKQYSNRDQNQKDLKSEPKETPRFKPQQKLIRTFSEKMFVSKSRIHQNRKIRVISLRKERQKSEESSRSYSDQSACGREINLIEQKRSSCSSGSRESSHREGKAYSLIDRTPIERFKKSQDQVPEPEERKSSSINAINAAAAEGQDLSCSFGPQMIIRSNQSEVGEKVPDQDEQELIDLSDSTAQELAPNSLHFSQTKNHSKLT